MPEDPVCAPSWLTVVTRSLLRRRDAPIVAVLVIIAAGCANTVASSTRVESGRETTPQPTLELDESATTTAPLETPDRSETTATAVPSRPAETTSTQAPTTTTSSTTTAPATSTTTTTQPDPFTGVYDATCVRVADERGLDAIAEGMADVGSTTSLWIENGFREALAVGDLVDVCVDNGINDIAGESAPRHDDPAVTAAVSDEVRRQQEKLNELFAPFGTMPLAVDGVSGPRTGQRLCAARVALGFDASIADLQLGSSEHASLFAAESLPTPTSTATEADRWVLIDRTCQWMFVGSGSDLVFAFPTSTGTAGFETRIQDRAEIFRYNPAVDNGGWHDSTEYPAGVDNPLNGNLYKPLYFDFGQAIHGANNVPATPASKGCARLSVANQEQLLRWLGLLDAAEETWRRPEINLTVNVQGDFVAR